MKVTPNLYLRLWILLLSLFLYVALFLVLYPLAGNPIAALGVAPIVVAGWFMGFAGSLIIGLLSIPLNLMLLGYFGDSSAANPIAATSVFLVYTLVGSAAAWVRALLREVDRQATELQAERKILQEAMMKKIEAEERLVHQVLHDPLTDLPNRRLFSERLRHAIDWGRRHPDSQSAVVYLDLDHFKVVNDSLGHNVGDQLLIEVAQRLTLSVRNMDTVARMGGDEFAILLEDLKYAGEVFQIVSRLQEDLAAPFEAIGDAMVMTASIGVVMNLLQYESIDDIIRDADIAMYGAKGDGKNCCRVFDTVMREQTDKILKLA